MIKSSARIYSVPEIYEMVKQGSFSQEFFEYIQSAPENIKALMQIEDIYKEAVTEDIINNPYEELDFNKRLHVKNIILHEKVGLECEIHQIPFTDIQVVTALNKGQYSMIVPCCPICKKLYMDKKRFNEMEMILRKKEIHYKWIPAKVEEMS